MEVRPGATHAVVVCESMFGNTRAVADAIAASLALRFDHVDVFDVADAPRALDDVSLLVVGAPTHAFGMSRPSTRQAANEQGANAGERGVREWLAELTRPARPIRAAVFDTRIRKPLMPGSAAKAIRRRLRHLGFEVFGPVSFGVAGTTGPLVDGEIDRARQWAAAIEIIAQPTARTS
jgi:hypothetical protein